MAIEDRWKTHRTWLAPALAFALSGIILSLWAVNDERFRIDEAHKISETRFYRLLESGDFHNPDWLRHPVDRSNPPLGKFLFGLSMRLHGVELPADLKVARYLEERQIHEPPGEVNVLYRLALTPIRRVSLVSASLIAAILFWAASRLAGTLAAILTTCLYLGSDLTLGYARSGVFDPLLTMMATATLIPLVLLWERKGAGWVWPSIGAGAAAGLASQVRLSGAIVFAGIIGVTVLLIVSTQRWSHLRITAVAALSAILLATGINPFYWATSPSGSGLAAELSGDQLLPFRIAIRYQIQFQDLSNILRETAGAESLSFIGKWRFFTEQVTGDWSGLLMLLGACLAIGALFLRALRTPDLLFASVWTLSIIATFLIWLPLSWPRYGVFVVPMMALLGGMGWGRVLRHVKLFSREVKGLSQNE